MNKLTVKYFGVVAEITHTAEEELNIADNMSVRDVLDTCLQKYPGLKDVSFKMAHNHKMTEAGAVKPMDEIAFLPPFSGG